MAMLLVDHESYTNLKIEQSREALGGRRAMLAGPRVVSLL